MSELSPDAASEGSVWSRRKFLGLAGARVVSQVLGLGWFLLAARLLSEQEFGVVASGLAFFAVFAGLGDLGMTRTVVRRVAADPTVLWSTYTGALKFRMLGGLSVALVGAVFVGVFATRVEVWVVPLAGIIATTSGATELAYAGLRSVGRVRTEMVTLITERAGFLLVGAVLLQAGAGPFGILALYAVTNTVTAMVGAVMVHRARPPVAGQPESIVDREARMTAIAFALVTVGPRASAVILALVVGSEAVATLTVAQRPTEAAALFAMSTAAPLLPIVRSYTVRGQHAAAERAAQAVLAALFVGLAPVVALCTVAPRAALDLLVGSGRYLAAEGALIAVVWTALSWTARGVGELLLLAQERASRFLVIAVVGVATTVGLGAPLASWKGVGGAVAALVGAEAIMTVMLATSLPALVTRRLATLSFAAVAIGGLAALTLYPFRTEPLPTVGTTVVWLVVAAVAAARILRHLDAEPK